MRPSTPTSAPGTRRSSKTAAAAAWTGTLHAHQRLRRRGGASAAPRPRPRSRSTRRSSRWPPSSTSARSRTTRRRSVCTGDRQPRSTAAPRASSATTTIAPLTMATAFAGIANNGLTCTPIAIDKIVERRRQGGDASRIQVHAVDRPRDREHHGERPQGTDRERHRRGHEPHRQGHARQDRDHRRQRAALARRRDHQGGRRVLGRQRHGRHRHAHDLPDARHHARDRAHRGDAHHDVRRGRASTAATTSPRRRASSSTACRSTIPDLTGKSPGRGEGHPDRARTRPAPTAAPRTPRCPPGRSRPPTRPPAPR